MKKYNLVEGVMVEDENGMYILHSDHVTTINTINAQLGAMNAYSTVVQSYIETLL